MKGTAVQVKYETITIESGDEVGSTSYFDLSELSLEQIKELAFELRVEGLSIQLRDDSELVVVHDLSRFYVIKSCFNRALKGDWDLLNK